MNQSETFLSWVAKLKFLNNSDLGYKACTSSMVDLGDEPLEYRLPPAQIQKFQPENTLKLNISDYLRIILSFIYSEDGCWSFYSKDSSTGGGEGTCLFGRLKNRVFKWEENKFLLFKCEEMKGWGHCKSEHAKISKS